MYSGFMDDDMVVRLEQKAEHHAREAERYRIAAQVIRAELGGSRRSAATRRDSERTLRVPDDPRTSTMAMVERALNENDRALHPTELVDEMLRLEWRSKAEHPVNSVRTAAHRLVDAGRIQRLDNGLFARLGLQRNDPPAAGDVPATETPEPSAEVQPGFIPLTGGAT